MILHTLRLMPLGLTGVSLSLVSLGKLFAQLGIYQLERPLALMSLAVLMPVAMRALFDRRAVIAELSSNPSIQASFGTFFMALQQHATYLSELSVTLARIVVILAFYLHCLLAAWYIHSRLISRTLSEVTATAFVCNAGILITPVVAPTVHLRQLGSVVFFIGCMLYLITMGIVTLRHVQHPLSEQEFPTICIYAAPTSLMTVAYLSSFNRPDPRITLLLVVIAQTFYFLVLCLLPCALHSPFIPYFSSLTFPFVIVPTAALRASRLLGDMGVGDTLELLGKIETLIGCILVTYVMIRLLINIPNLCQFKFGKRPSS